MRSRSCLHAPGSPKRPPAPLRAVRVIQGASCDLQQPVRKRHVHREPARVRNSGSCDQDHGPRPTGCQAHPAIGPGNAGVLYSSPRLAPDLACAGHGSNAGRDRERRHLMLAQTGGTQSLPARLGVAGIAIVVGGLLIATGLANVRTRSAQESGGRRLVNRATGRANTYSGSSAVLLGWLRVVMGVVAVGFGIVFAFTGPMLA